jgi:hypothetical protein
MCVIEFLHGRECSIGSFPDVVDILAVVLDHIDPNEPVALGRERDDTAIEEFDLVVALVPARELESGRIRPASQMIMRRLPVRHEILPKTQLSQSTKSSGTSPPLDASMVARNSSSCSSSVTNQAEDLGCAIVGLVDRVAVRDGAPTAIAIRMLVLDVPGEVVSLVRRFPKHM